DWRRERAQRRVMPAVFAHTWPTDFAEAHFNFVGDDGAENQLLAAQTFAFTERQRRSDEIAGMTWIRFPINVVVIHRADHVSVQKRRIDRIGLEPGHERCGAPFPPALATGRARRGGHRAIVLQQDLRVILLTAAEGAADGVEPK